MYLRVCMDMTNPGVCCIVLRVCVYACMCMFARVRTFSYTHVCVCAYTCKSVYGYGVAATSRIDKIIGLFCKRAL